MILQIFYAIINISEFYIEVKSLGKAILALFVTLVIGLLTMSIFTGATDVGLLVAICVMGAFIIYFNDTKRG